MERRSAAGHDASAERAASRLSRGDAEADRAPTPTAWTPRTPGVGDVLRLQTRIGNGAVHRMLRGDAGGAGVGLRRAPPSIQRVKTAEEVTALVEGAVRAQDTTAQEVRTVLEFMNHGDRIADVLVGHTVRFKRLAEGNNDKNCHHFAFGGLTGADGLFNVGALAQSLGATLTFEQYHQRHGAEEDAMDAETYAFAGPVTDFGVLEADPVDVTGALGLQGARVRYAVRMYDGMAHSARRVEDRWWHKFVGFPFVVSVEGAENLHYGAPTASLSIDAPAAAFQSEGSFTLA
jgi:hypothetical protein